MERLNPGSLTSEMAVASTDQISAGPSRFGLTAAPFCAIKFSTLTLGFRSESLHQGRGFESHPHRRKATSLTYEDQIR